jgi:hypothetical protein
MKVLIQSEETGLYFREPGQWSQDERRARLFAGSLEAIDFCLKHKVDNVVIVLKFGDPRYDIHLRPFASKGRRKTQTPAASESENPDSGSGRS